MKKLFSIIAIFLTTQIFAQVPLIINGNFSSTGSWTADPDFYYGTTYSNCPCGTPPCYGYAYLSTPGGQPGNDLGGSLEQFITLQQTYSSATLTFCWSATSTETVPNSDFFAVYIFSTTPFHTVTAYSTSIVGNHSGSTVTYNLTDPALLQAGLTIEVDFEAATDGGLPSTIRVDDVSLIGYPVANAPIISLSGNMNFGNVQVGNTSQQNLIITNTGNTNLNISTISFPTGFTGNWNATITPGSSQNVPVTFAPVSAITYSGNITVNSNASSGTNTMACSGTGTTVSSPAISLSGNMNFGNVQVGNTSTQTLTISNSGNATLNISSIVYPAGFTGSWSGNIGVGSSQNVNVTFAPVSASTYSGNITVNSNASSGTNTISSSGTGTTVSSPTINLSGNMNFGNVQVGNTSTQTLTISNSGNATLNVSSIAYPTGFTGSWSGNIGAGSSQNVPVTFAPVSATTFSGNITVNSNATSGTNTIACSGTGNIICSAPTSQASSLNFSGVSSTQMNVNWTNGTGNRRVAIINTINNFTVPLNGTDPVGNSVYGGSGAQVIYNGINNNVTVSGLNPNTNYWVRVYEGSCTGTSSLYNASNATNNPINHTTSPLTPSVNSITFTNVIQNHPAITPEHTLYNGSPYVMTSPIKICADGSTSTFIKVNVSNTSGISFRILDDLGNVVTDGTLATNPSIYGQLETPYTFPGNNVEIPYTHPQFLETGLFRNLTLQVLYNGNPINGINFPLNIYRAPALFIHGLWGDAGTFLELEDYLIANNIYPQHPNPINYTYDSHSQLTLRGDYAIDNAKSFSENAIYMYLFMTKIFSQTRRFNFSAGKVDVICHSMGGILARLYLQNDNAVIQYKNDIHKLITLNTSHYGSQVANYLLAPQNANIVIALNAIQNYPCDQGAVHDLRYNSTAISQHLNITPAAQINKVPSNTIYTVGYDSSDPKANALHLIVDNAVNTQNIFNGEVHDLIVPLSSQKGGWSLSQPLISGQWHVGSSKNIGMKVKVMNRINANPTDQTIFTNSGFLQGAITMPSPAINSRFNQASTDSIEIVNITNNQQFYANDSIYVNVRASGGISKIILYGGNQFTEPYSKDTLAQTAIFGFKIPPEAIGKYYLCALGFSSANPVIIDSVAINILNTASLDSITSNKRTVDLHVGLSTLLSIKGHFSDGVVRDISNLPQLTIITDTTIIKHVGNSMLTGISTGDTLLSISFQGASTQVYVHVSEDTALFLANLGVDDTQVCSGTSLNFRNQSTGNPNSIQWYFPGGTPSSSSDQEPIITYNTAGEYGVTLIAFYSNKIDTLTLPNYIKINPSPTASISASGSTSFCLGDSVILSSNSAIDYLWSNGSVDQFTTIYVPGNITVSITDSNGCSATSNPILISVRQLPSISTFTTNVSCFGNTDGTIVASVNSGSSPYAYSWSPSGGALATASNLPADNYTLTVTDSAGCSANANINITQPATLTAAMGALTNVHCYGGNDGSATVYPAGGTAPYTYLWSSGATIQTATNLSATNYVCDVIDTNGCTASLNLAIGEPAQLILTKTIIHATCGTCCDGQATVTPSGGIAGYSYLWINNGNTSQSLNSLCADTFIVIVTDSNFCTITDSVVVSYGVGMKEMPTTKKFLAYPNPSTGMITIEINSGENENVSLKVFSSTGIRIFDEELYIYRKSRFEIDLSNYSNGIYLIQLMSNKACHSQLLVIE